MQSVLEFGCGVAERFLNILLELARVDSNHSEGLWLLGVAPENSGSDKQRVSAAFVVLGDVAECCSAIVRLERVKTKLGSSHFLLAFFM